MPKLSDPVCGADPQPGHFKIAIIAQFGFAYTSPALPNQRVITPPPDMLPI
jgi:hypothetical protein